MKKLLFLLLIIFAFSCEKEPITDVYPGKEFCRECFVEYKQNGIWNNTTVGFCDRTELGLSPTGVITDNDMNNYIKKNSNTNVYYTCYKIK